MHEAAPSYLPVVIVAVLAFLVPLISARIRWIALPVVVGEILAGMLVGESGFRLVRPDQILSFLSDFGLIYLMFLSGLELDLAHLLGLERRSGRRVVFWRHPIFLPGAVFVLTLGISLFISGVLAARGLLADRWLAGFIFATTSLGIVLPVLKERGLAGSPYGQSLLAFSSLADFVTMILIAGWAAMRGGGGPSEVLYILILLVMVVQFYRAGLIFTSVPLVRRLFAAATGHFDVRAALALVLIFVAFSQELGVETILGAFMAGAIISLLSRQGDDTLRVKLDAIGFGFFIPIFFIMFGATFDLRAAIASPTTWILLPVFLVAAFLVKLVPLLLFRLEHSWRRSLGGGFLVSAQLSLTIAAAEIGQRLGVLDEPTVSAFLMMAIMTSLVAPLLFNRLVRETDGGRDMTVVAGDSSLAAALAQRLGGPGRVTLIAYPPLDAEGQGIVRASGSPELDLRLAGAGRAGTLVAMLNSADFNAELVRAARAAGVENIVVMAVRPEDFPATDTEGVRVVTPELSLLMLLELAVRAPGALELIRGLDDETAIGEAVLRNPELDGCLLRECRLPPGCLVIGVRRGSDRLLPHGETRLRRGDELTMLCARSEYERVRTLIENGVENSVAGEST